MRKGGFYCPAVIYRVAGVDEPATLHWPLYNTRASLLTLIAPVLRSMSKLKGSPAPRSIRNVILASVMAAVATLLETYAS